MKGESQDEGGLVETAWKHRAARPRLFTPLEARLLLALLALLVFVIYALISRQPVP